MESYDSITFAAALAKLGMSKDASSGLRFVSRRFEENDVDIYWALEQANGFGATAVYFRFYNDKRPPKPQIYIYDNSDITHEKIKVLIFIINFGMRVLFLFAFCLKQIEYLYIIVARNLNGIQLEKTSSHHRMI